MSEKMTIRERAERLCFEFFEAAIDDVLKNNLQTIEAELIAVRKEALDDAARVAETWVSDVPGAVDLAAPSEIAAAIRALAEATDKQ